MRDYYALWVCTDCIMHHASGECGGCHEDEHQGGEPLSKLGPEATAGMLNESHECGRENDEDIEECDCETITYSTRSCDGCGSDYHGERHAMTEWV